MVAVVLHGTVPGWGVRMMTLACESLLSSIAVAATLSRPCGSSRPFNPSFTTFLLT